MMGLSEHVACFCALISVYIYYVSQAAFVMWTCHVILPLPYVPDPEADVECQCSSLPL
jgi:hypothetical protein